MKTSARNALAGTVSKITKGAVNSEVELTTSHGTVVVSIITDSSVAGDRNRISKKCRWSKEERMVGPGGRF